MNNPLSTVTRVLAALCAVAFVLVTVPGLAGFNAQRSAFNPALYKRSLADQGIYQRFPALIADQIVVQLKYEDSLPDNDPLKQPVDPHLKTLTRADYEAILSDLITPDYAQAQTESVIDQVFGYWNGKEESVPVTISIVEIKARFTGDVAVRAFARVVGSWPECNLVQLLAWGGLVTGVKLADLPVCRPPDTLTQAVIPVITSLVSEAVLTQLINAITNAAVSRAPDQVVIFHLPPTPEEIQPNQPPPVPRSRVTLLRWAARLSLLLALGLLGLTVVLGARSIKGVLLWSGIPLLLAGLACALLAVVAHFGLSQIVQPIASAISEPPIAPSIAAIAVRVGEDVARSVVLWTGAEGVALAAAGFFLTVIGGAMQMIGSPTQER
jgi:hypothetical protein